MFALLHFLQQCRCLLTPRAAQIRSESKTAKTMALILGVHMLSLTPYLAVVVWRYFSPEEAAPLLSDAKKVKGPPLQFKGYGDLDCSALFVLLGIL